MAILYGLLNQADLAASRVTEIGVTEVDESIALSVAEHNRQLDALMSLFVRRTTDHKTRFFSASSARLQPLDNNGRARPIKPAGMYDVGFPLEMGGSAWGFDFVTGEYLTVGEVARTMNTLMDADSRWVRDKILAALLTSASWTFVDPLHGSLTVENLADGDATTYNILSGADASATDDHILGSATVTTTVFDNIRDELREHPENGGQIIALIPTNIRSTVEGLTGFQEILDPNLRYGTGVTVLDATLNVPIPGTVIGYLDGVWIVEWASMPSNYVIGLPTEGERALAMREDPIASLRGFRKVADRDDHPYYERQYIRRAGFGVWSRIGAVAYRVNDATYATPANYSPPII